MQIVTTTTTLENILVIETTVTDDNDTFIVRKKFALPLQKKDIAVVKAMKIKLKKQLQTLEKEQLIATQMQNELNALQPYL
jgi:hypothetical protein